MIWRGTADCCVCLCLRACVCVCVGVGVCVCVCGCGCLLCVYDASAVARRAWPKIQTKRPGKLHIRKVNPAFSEANIHIEDVQKNEVVSFCSCFYGGALSRSVCCVLLLFFGRNV
jgi:hypothetical protein